MEVLARFLIGLAGNGDAARCGDGFKADRDVHAVAKNLVFVGHHVAHVNAEAELHDPIRRQLAIALGHQRLDFDGGLERANDAGIFQKETVAGVLHQAAAVVENDRIDRAAMSLEGRMRAFFVGTHHSGVAGDVSANNGGQASLHPQRISCGRDPAGAKVRGRATESNGLKRAVSRRTTVTREQLSWRSCSGCPLSR